MTLVKRYSFYTTLTVVNVFDFLDCIELTEFVLNLASEFQLEHCNRFREGENV